MAALAIGILGASPSTASGAAALPLSYGDPNGSFRPLDIHNSGRPTDLYVNYREWDLASPFAATIYTNGAVATTTNTSTIWTRAYGLEKDGKPSIPAPTIHFRPGQLLQINLHNDLEGEDLVDFEDALESALDNDEPIRGTTHQEVNIPHNPDNTNLHVHGLHVDPSRDDVTYVLIPPNEKRQDYSKMLQMKIPPFIYDTTSPISDELIDGWRIPTLPAMKATAKMGIKGPSVEAIVAAIAKGEKALLRLLQQNNLFWGVSIGVSWPYQYVIPKDHLPGTHWYHAHKHGATSTHVENGMAGSFVISPFTDQYIYPDFPPALDIPLVLQKIANFALGHGNGQTKAANIAGAGASQIQSTVNGIAYSTNNNQSVVKLATSQIARFRIINGGSNHKSITYLWLGVDNNNDGVPDTDGSSNVITYPLTLAAVDGITLSTPYTTDYKRPLFMAPGNRADVFIKTPNTNTNLVLFENDPTTGGTPLGNTIANSYNLTEQSFQPVYWKQAVSSPAFTLATNTLSNGDQYLNLVKQNTNVVNTWQPARPILSGDKSSGQLSINLAEVKAAQFPSGSWQVGPGVEQGGGATTAGALLAISVDSTQRRYHGEPSSLPTAATLSPVSPTTSNPSSTRLVKLENGQIKPGIPGYVAPFPSGKTPPKSRVVVFDKAGVNFTYTNPGTTNTSKPINQFSLNGRLFDLNDSVGDADALSLIQAQALENVDINGGTVTRNSQGIKTWDNQVLINNQTNVFWTNPGYFNSIANVGTATSPVFDFDTSNSHAPTYQEVTGIDNPGKPQAQSWEEWLIINNSSINHPFHIHINPFLVTEIGVLKFTDANGETPTTAQGRGYVKGSWDMTTLPSGTDHPLGYVVNNWWDTIIIPPHGYVKMRMWINVPTQQPPAPQYVNAGGGQWSIKENDNAERSWVFHCHILRHEDRGMMMIVETEKAD